MEISATFLLVGIVITLAAFLGAWAAFLKQPVFIAYIVAGIIAGPLIFRNETQTEIFALLRDLGLSLVLFLIGLELKINDLKRFGRPTLIIGLKQIGFTFLLSVVVAKLLGLSLTAAVYVGIALAFSSTIVVVKLLTEKRDFDSLYGQLTVAILLLQDVLAIFVLIIIAGIGVGSFSVLSLASSVIVGGLLLAVGYLLSRGLLPYVFERLAYNSELLFIGSLAWLFIAASAASFAGLSIEIGAFLAGVGLANLAQEHQIAARVRPLRDFFILIFFIFIGASLKFENLFDSLLPALVFSVVVLTVKPLVTAFLLSREGFRKRTSFLVGISLGQVSEFSLIVLFLGVSIGQIEESLVSTLTITTLITIAVSSYALKNSTRIYRRVNKYLDFFEPSRRLEDGEERISRQGHFVLIGAGRLGWDILRYLRKHDQEVLVVDFNPIVAEDLRAYGVPVLFGDITDPEILEKANLPASKLVISTMFDLEDSRELLDFVRSFASEVPLVVTSPTEDQALELYQAGANYVIIPRVISGKFFTSLLSGENLDQLVNGEMRNEQVDFLTERIQARRITNS